MHFCVDKSRRIRLDVKCVITATLICPSGGVNSGRRTLLEMIHSVTHSIKRHRRECALPGKPLRGRSPREQRPAVTEQKGFSAHHRKYARVRILRFRNKIRFLMSLMLF